MRLVLWVLHLKNDEIKFLRLILTEGDASSGRWRAAASVDASMSTTMGISSVHASNFSYREIRGMSPRFRTSY